MASLSLWCYIFIKNLSSRHELAIQHTLLMIGISSTIHTNPKITHRTPSSHNHSSHNPTPPPPLLLRRRQLLRLQVQGVKEMVGVEVQVVVEVAR
jgi:hypothetical protein